MRAARPVRGCENSRSSFPIAWSSFRAPCAPATPFRWLSRWCYKEFSDPLAGEFRRTFEEQNLGQPLEIVLKKMGRRIPSVDANFFVSAVLLQKRTGGNLAELLDKLAEIIRQRFKLRARIRAISAQGLMSGRILASIPAAVGALMFVVNPTYARFFVDDPAGHEMLAGAFLLQLLGYWIIRKIVTIEV